MSIADDQLHAIIFINKDYLIKLYGFTNTEI